MVSILQTQNEVNLLKSNSIPVDFSDNNEVCIEESEKHSITRFSLTAKLVGKKNSFEHLQLQQKI